ncbi:MAG: hypothetical protein MJ093_05685 [Saccharofermentans sp.]|nr:hypothetical protein [Saccharofermentans sp.]
MNYKVSLDFGGSSTKIVCMNGNEVIYKGIIYSTSKKSAFDRSIESIKQNTKIDLTKVEYINITGAGESFFEDEYNGFRLNHIQEFGATSLGALFLADIDEAIVVSMGTGTAFYKTRKNEVTHIIGTGVGGGSLCGLSKLLFENLPIDEVDKLAMEGEANNVDLTIGDISNGDMPGLPEDLTASNFGKVVGNSEKKDIAAGLFNMVFQTIGTMTVMAIKNTGIQNVVLTGQVSTLNSCMRVLNDFNNFYGTNIIVPDNSTYATAIGACLLGE